MPNTTKPKYAQILSRPVPQTEPLNSRQSPNHAGGFGYVVSDLTMLDRFVLLGTIGGTFYVGERELTTEAIDAVRRALTDHGPLAVARIAELDVAGRAAKKSPALFALALAATVPDEATRA
ncbi:TROVE domain-containing protein, partial [bacterium]